MRIDNKMVCIFIRCNKIIFGGNMYVTVILFSCIDGIVINNLIININNI